MTVPKIEDSDDKSQCIFVHYLYRAVDQFGQVIDVLLSQKRDAAAARRFFTRALRQAPGPVEVTTDKAPAYLGVLDELLPSAGHVTEQYGNNQIESDHGRLKARLRPMRGLKRFATTAVIALGHAFVQNLRRGHYELALEPHPRSGSQQRSPSSPGPSDRKTHPRPRASGSQQRNVCIR